MFSAKVLFLLIASTFLQYTSQEKQIRGLPEVDYPTYYTIPKTSFRCSDQLYNPGFYADTETRCQVFHYCYEHRQESFLCPMGTIFNQPILACDYWYSSNCSLALSYYHVNAEKPNEDNFDAVDDLLDSQSENLFDKMAHLYEINETPEPPVLKNDSDIPEMELIGRVGVESTGIPLIEETKTEDYNKYSYDHFNMVDEVHPEIVKYEVRGTDTLNIHQDYEKEHQYQTDDVKDFIFSEDGMLHPRQDDYQYPTDMNFNQEYSGYAEIPSEQNFNYDFNDDFNPESDFQISDFVLQKRYADVNGGYVKRRPSSRKPVIVIPEVEPEIVQLPVKHQRKPIRITSTVSTNANAESSYETNHDFNIYKEDTISAANEVSERTITGEFPLNEPNFDLSDYELRDPKLFYKIQQETDDENGSQLPQTDRLSVNYDYSIKRKTRKEYVSNIDENESSSVLESGSNGVLDVWNVEHRNSLVDSNNDEESEIFIGKVEDSTMLPDESSEATVQDENNFDLFLGSGSEEINQSHSRDQSIFPEDYDIFSDSDDTEITDTEASYALPMDLFDEFEGSGLSVQETANIPNFTEEVNDLAQLDLKEHPEDNINHRKELSISSETSGIFSPLGTSEDDEEAESVTDGSGEANGSNYLPHELQESSDSSEDSDKIVPGIQEIDGSFYVFSDSEYHFNHGYDDSSGFYPENVDFAFYENFADVSDKTTKWVGNERFHNVPTESNLKINNIGNDTLHTLDSQDSRHLVNPYEKFSDEFETDTMSDSHEKYIDDESVRAKPLSTEDLRYLEIMSQNHSPMLKNLFEVSTEKLSSDVVKDEMPRIEIESAEQDMIVKAATNEDSASIKDVNESKSLAADISSAIGERTADIESSENNSEVLSAEPAEEISNTEGSGQDGSEIFSPEQNFKAFQTGKEGDPFDSFAESDKIMLDGPESKQELSLKVSPAQLKSAAVNAGMGKDLKKIARGKRFNENLRIFNPPNKGNPLNVPKTETFREAMFTNIPSAFLKMKHSTLRPYFYNYGLENSGFIPRTGDFQSSKLSELTTLGKRLLSAKTAKFNKVKKFIESYRN